jgi:glucose/arabinose dehydrogenase
MQLRPLSLLLVLLLVGLAGCAKDEPDEAVPVPTGRQPGTGIAFERLADGLVAPVLLVSAPGSGDRYVVEQGGKIWQFSGAARMLILDIKDKVTSGASQGGSEQGLLGLAFHPDFDDNGVAILSYTDRDGHSVLARYRMAGSFLDPASEEVLLRVQQPFANHNGGHIEYGPDGYLYYGLGDGGSAGDPFGNGQNRNTLLGSILRLDVGPSGPYGVPDDNPFVGGDGADEVWAYGLRNPWRFHFDAENGDLWMGDVGQNAYEEINHQPAGSKGGENYGWNLYEGNHQFPSGVDVLRAPGMVFPVAEYSHDGGHCSVTGGFVYRGSLMLDLQGKYVFGDYCSGVIWAMQPGSAPEVVAETEYRISSFGTDAAVELFILDHQGAVWQFVPKATDADA